MISRVHATLEPVPSENGEGKIFFLIFNLFLHHIQCDKSPSTYSSNLTHMMYLETERWKLVDHSSRNGSFVNNMKVSEVVLKHGKLIIFPFTSFLSSFTD